MLTHGAADEMKIPSREPDIINAKLKLMAVNKIPDSFITNLGHEYEWIWLTSSDVNQLLNLRNAEHVLSNMRNTSPISEVEHLDFLKKYNTLQRVDFILLDKENGQYVGGMNISLATYGFEIGKYIGNKDYLGQGIAYPMSRSFLHFVKECISDIGKIRAVTRMDNYKNINLNFKLNFKIIQLVDRNYWLMEMK